MVRRFEACRGFCRIVACYPLVPLARSLARYGTGPLALLAVTAGRHPARVAWRDEAGELTYADLVAAILRRPSDGPAIVRSERPRDLMLDVMAALSAGHGVAVLGSRGGTLASEPPPSRGVSFLTSGTTGAPKAHQQARRITSLLPYLGMVGRLPRLRSPLVGSPSHPDHGHAFLLVVLTWALSGTYVQITAPTGRLDVLSGVPVQLSDLLDHGWCEAASLVVSGSDVLTPELAGRLSEELGGEVWNAYGATETGPISLAEPPDVAAGTVGRPLPAVRVRVEGDRLVVRTPAAAAPFTGDRGHLDAQARIVLRGRADRRHVSGGEVVDPELLRAWLASQPGVRAVTVALAPDERFGARLTASVTGELEEDRALLRERIRTELGPAHVPRVITLRQTGSGLGESGV